MKKIYKIALCVLCAHATSTLGVEDSKHEVSTNDETYSASGESETLQALQKAKTELKEKDRELNQALKGKEELRKKLTEQINLAAELQTNLELMENQIRYDYQRMGKALEYERDEAREDLSRAWKESENARLQMKQKADRIEEELKKQKAEAAERIEEALKNAQAAQSELEQAKEQAWEDREEAHATLEKARAGAFEELRKARAGAFEELRKARAGAFEELKQAREALNQALKGTVQALKEKEELRQKLQQKDGALNQAREALSQVEEALQQKDGELNQAREALQQKDGELKQAQKEAEAARLKQAQKEAEAAQNKVNEAGKKGSAWCKKALVGAGGGLLFSKGILDYAGPDALDNFTPGFWQEGAAYGITSQPKTESLRPNDVFLLAQDNPFPGDINPNPYADSLVNTSDTSWGLGSSFESPAYTKDSQSISEYLYDNDGFTPNPNFTPETQVKENENKAQQDVREKTDQPKKVQKAQKKEKKWNESPFVILTKLAGL